MKEEKNIKAYKGKEHKISTVRGFLYFIFNFDKEEKVVGISFIEDILTKLMI